MLMTDLIETLLERVADWPKEAQAEVVKAIVDIETKYFGVCKLSAEERAAILAAKAQAERGEFASDEEVAALFNRYRS
jgi:predicted transcriptional regulator